MLGVKVKLIIQIAVGGSDLELLDHLDSVALLVAFWGFDSTG